MRALLFDPGGIGNARPSRRPDAAFHHLNGVGSRKLAIFGAQSHGPQTRCLRFAGWITPPPRKTRFRLPARLCRAGLATRWVPTRGFSFYIASPSPRLRLAQSGRSRRGSNALARKPDFNWRPRLGGQNCEASCLWPSSSHTVRRRAVARNRTLDPPCRAFASSSAFE